jgi:hypothetical protein
MCSGVLRVIRSSGLVYWRMMMMNRRLFLHCNQHLPIGQSSQKPIIEDFLIAPARWLQVLPLYSHRGAVYQP